MPPQPSPAPPAESALVMGGQNECVRAALEAGVLSAAIGAALAGAAVFGAARLSPGFRAALGPSGRAALVATPAFGLFFLKSELAMSECARKRRWAERRERAGGGPGVGGRPTGSGG
jgi:hypothetical protein